MKTNRGLWAAVLTAVFFCFVSGNVFAVLSGAGTEANPYLIQSRADFDEFSNPANAALYWASGKYAKLMCDPNLADTTYTQAVIGSYSGIFDGNGQIISNLTINTSGKGLFGSVGLGGKIRNLGVENVYITGYSNVGGLVGYNSGSINNCYVTGSVSGSSNVGGLVGDSSGALNSCCATGAVSGSSNVGGLMGRNSGNLAACYATGVVSGSYYVGGLAGYRSSGSITACFWDTQTSGQSVGVGSGSSAGVTGKTTTEMMTISTFATAGWSISDVNGFDANWIMLPDGQNYPQLAYFFYCGSSGTVPLLGDGTQQNPYQIQSPADLVTLCQYGHVWNKYITLMADLDMAGFALRPIGNSIIRFTGNFNGQDFVIRNAAMNMPNKNLVGLFGSVGSGGVITNLGVEDVNMVGKQYVGGLVGRNNKGIISNCHSSGWVAGKSSSSIGGLIGHSLGGTISTCYSSVNVSGEGANIGGLVGCSFAGSTIANCSASGTVTDIDPNNFGSSAGGLVGHDYYSTIVNCSATGNVSTASASSSASMNIGGFVGGSISGTISNCYATGNVHTTSTSSSGLVSGGGLVGFNSSGDMDDCYATGSITFGCSADSGYFIGGMTGLNYESVVNRCYANGQVGSSGSAEADCCVGGFSGYNMDGMVYGCFWDIEISSKVISGGGRGLTTEQMKTMSIYQNAGWADKGWIIDEGQDYPRLVWEETDGVAIPASSDVELTGSGTAENPYQIWTAQDFAIWGQYASVLDKHTILKADLDLNGVLLYPIGEYGPFTGTFDGNGHVIRNITITQPTNSYVGFFSHVGSGGVITNLGIEDVNVIGGDYVGALIGKNQGGTVSDCYSTGTVGGYDYIGGLIGINEGGMVNNCYSEAIVTAWGSVDSESCVGGLLGYNSGTLTSCYATGSVTGHFNAGGLAGENSFGSITSCYATGSVTGTFYVGGLVGYSSGTLNSCCATGSVTGTSYVGGLVGRSGAAIINCYSTGFVSPSSNSYYSPAGGLVGGNSASGSITACFWDRQTSGKIATGVGSGSSTGVVGKTTTEMKTISTFANAGWDFSATDGDPADWWMPYNDYPRLAWDLYSGGSGTIMDPYQISSVTDFVEFSTTSTDWDKCFILIADIDLNGMIFTQAPIAPDTNSTDWDFQGTPFTGIFDGNGQKISNLTITASIQDYVGLFGYVDASSQIRSLGLENVYITGRYYVGGMVGVNSASLTDCYATGFVTGTDDYVGGLVGDNYYGTLTSCYAIDSVAGIGGVGGLVGDNYHGTLTSCYATGSVAGLWYVGGLVGENNSGILTACYAAGSVNANYDIGGLVGWNYHGTIGSCFWDTQVSGRSNGIGYGSSVGLTGKTTTEMMTLSTFTSAGWDFSTTDGDAVDWMMLRPGEDYPRLAQQAIISGDIAGLYGISADDLEVLSGCWLETVQAKPDINNDDTVNLHDFMMVAQQWLITDCGLCGGADITGDGSVDQSDLILMADQWLLQENVGCRMTDLNSDGKINLADYAIFAQHWLEGV